MNAWSSVRRVMGARAVPWFSRAGFYATAAVVVLNVIFLVGLLYGGPEVEHRVEAAMVTFTGIAVVYIVIVWLGAFIVHVASWKAKKPASPGEKEGTP